MTAQLYTPPATSPEAAPPPRKPNTVKLQQRCMLVLTLGFFVEVVAYSLMPEGFLRALTVAALGILITWCMFRFGVND